MNLKTTLVYCLSILAGLLSLISCVNAAAASSDCTPVVYAFRHAEDEGQHLTPVGDRHAALYPGMVDGFGTSHNYCPVGFVYSMYDTNPDGNPGTYNPYETAEPLALRSCYLYWLALFNNEEISFTGTFNPDTICNGAGGEGFTTTPSMGLANGAKLYEFLGTKAGLTTKMPTATGPQLVKELLSNSLVGGGLSSAIFWSNEGLPTLGNAVSGTAIPDNPKPPRNAVYVFEQQGAAFAPTKLTYRQCFNIKVGGSTTPGGTTYWCSGVGNLPADTKDLPLLQGIICDTANLASDCQKGP